jgi:uncharacterized protein YgiM (DUF1202 family)
MHHFTRRITIFLVAALLLGMIPAVQPAAAQTSTSLAATVTNAYYLNTRTGPGVSYPVHQRLSYGQQITLIGRNASATWVQIQSGAVEWVNAYYVYTYGNVASLPISTATGTTSTTTGQGIAAVVAYAYYLNTRTGPGPTYPIHQRLSNGQQITLIGRNANGSWVQLQSGAVEWVNAAYLQISSSVLGLPISSSVGTSGSAPVYGTISGVFFLNVRTGPGVTYPVVGQLAAGNQVGLIGRNANTSWVQLQAGGAQQWINARYVSATGVLSALPVTSSVVPATTTPPVTYRTHIVQWGENLYRIALYYGVSLSMLAAWNGIYDYSRIYAGQVLVIP